MAVSKGLFGKAVSRRARRRWLRLRPAVDAAAALFVFVMVTLALGSVPTSANPQIPVQQFTQVATPAVANGAEAPAIVEIATTSSPQASDAVYRRTSSTAAWLLLSLAFSLLIAFNMAVLRHMRRAYARQGGKGRR